MNFTFADVGTLAGAIVGWGLGQVFKQPILGAVVGGVGGRAVGADVDLANARAQTDRLQAILGGK